jgi:hypothetical protein
MHLVETYEGQAAIRNSVCFFLFPFNDTELAKADRLEIWGSSFNDPGEDFTEYRLIKNGVAINTKRQAGY